MDQIRESQESLAQLHFELDLNESSGYQDIDSATSFKGFYVQHSHLFLHYK